MNLTYTFDIIEIKCQSPGYFNLHLLKKDFSKDLIIYQRQVAIVQKGIVYIYPSIKEDQTIINWEISTPLGKEIKIKSIDVEEIINSEKRFFQIQYAKETIPNNIQLDIIEDNILISIRQTDNYLYKIVNES